MANGEWRMANGEWRMEAAAKHSFEAKCVPKYNLGTRMSDREFDRFRSYRGLRGQVFAC